MRKTISDRLLYLDALRVFATFAVIMLHTSCYGWYAFDVTSIKWQVLNFFDSVVRWCVPVFVMISGALFLNRDYSVKTILKHILRIAIAFLIWSIFYNTIAKSILGQKSIYLSIYDIVAGHYHLWFLYMIVGLYVIVPILKPIVRPDTTCKYFLFLSLLFAFIIPQAYTIYDFFVKGQGYIPALILIKNRTSLYFPLGYSGYFVLGYFINKAHLSKKLRYSIYIMGGMGFILTIVLSSATSIYTHKATEIFYNYLSANVLLESCAIFTFFKSVCSCNESKLLQRICKLSPYCLNAYLIHAFLLEFIENRYALTIQSMSPMFYVPIVTIAVFIFSYICSFVTSKVLAKCRMLCYLRG